MNTFWHVQYYLFEKKRDELVGKKNPENWNQVHQIQLRIVHATPGYQQ